MEKQWSLESIGADGTQLDFTITKLPCRIGRSKENDLVIANLGLSRVHAVLSRDISGQLRLTDENSTNGTFVNRRRVDGYYLLKENDVIHFSSAEFKLRLTLVDHRAEQSFDEMQTMIAPENMALSEGFAPNETEFNELISGYGLSGAAQLGVKLSDHGELAVRLRARYDSHPAPRPPPPGTSWEAGYVPLADRLDTQTELLFIYRFL